MSTAAATGLVVVHLPHLDGADTRDRRPRGYLNRLFAVARLDDHDACDVLLGLDIGPVRHRERAPPRPDEGGGCRFMERAADDRRTAFQPLGIGHVLALE